MSIYTKLETELAIEPEETQTEMASDQHGEIGAIIIGALVNFVYPRKLGRVFNAQTSFVLSPGQPARMPDAAFIKRERMAAWSDSDVPFAPDLAVEVMSRSDDWSEVVRKAQSYLQAGSSLVWVVDPYAQNIFVFKPSTHVLMLTPQAELNGDTLLPGFSFRVGDLFEQPTLTSDANGSNPVNN